MPDGIARLWFIPGEGIDRQVISSDIQRYLGNDATVRPGLGTDDHEGVEGYWIKAQRNLTSYQVEDLTRASARWRHEQQTQHRRPGSSTTYAGSMTHHAQQGLRARGGDSPIADTVYGGMPNRRDPQRMDPRVSEPRLMQDPRLAEPRMPPAPRPGPDDMDVDYTPPPPSRPYDDRGFAPDRPSYHDGRTSYPESNGYRGPSGQYGYNPDPREMADGRDPRDPRDYRDPRDPRGNRDPREVRDIRDGRDARGPVDPRADLRPDIRSDPRFDSRDPRFDPRGPPQYPAGVGAGSGYQRQQDSGYYPPNTGSYGAMPPGAPSMQSPYGANGYPPATGPGQVPRESGREPRYGVAPGYPNDPRNDSRSAEARYAYPSPAVTVVDPRDTSPSAVPQSGYPPTSGQGPPQQPRYYDDGRPQAASVVGFPPGPPPGPFGSATISGPPRGPNQGQRPSGNSDLPEARRRRLN